MRRASLYRDESGVAMMTALLGIVVLAGLAVVFLARATTETRAASFSQDHESAIHVAEAAADVRIAAVSSDNEHVTALQDGLAAVIPPDTLGDARAEAAWLLELLPAARGSEAWIQNVDGEAYAVRPQIGAAGEPAEVIFAVSAVPSFDAPRARTRLIKLQIEQASFDPEYALLTNASLTMGGNAEIVAPSCDAASPTPDTCYADVHTNQAYTENGGPVIHGSVSTTTGSCTTSNALYGCTAGAEHKDVPELWAIDYYDPDEDLASGPTSVEWWDLCPDGTVKEGSLTGLPCTGTEVWNSSTGTTRYYGWRWNSGQRDWEGSAIESGMYYVHHADASVTGTVGSDRQTVSVFASQDPARPGSTGAIKVSGNPLLQAAGFNILFLAETDVTINGNATVSCGETDPPLSGLIYAGEQFNTQGNVSLRGSVLVQDGADVHNEVQRNNASIGGTMCLEFDRDLTYDLRGRWVVTFWNEL